MDEISNDKPITAAESSAAAANARQNWRQWLETDEAMRRVYLIFGLFAIVLLMIFLQFSIKAICCGDWDGYYHIRWSALLWESFRAGNGLPEFTWLPLTVLGEREYADHHFLFHLLQIPFLWFFEPVTAAKIAAVVFGSAAIFSCYWLMFRYKIEYMILWLVLLLTCANSFFYRINMAKAPPLTIIYTIAGIYLLFERKYIWLLPLMFVFVWTYSLFPILFIAAVFWTLIILWNERRFEWRPGVYTFAGMILGNIINPYFPQNLGLFSEHFLTKFKVGSDFAVSVGGEWYPFTGMELLLNFPVALLAMLAGYIFFYPKNGKLPEKATFFLMFATVLLAAQFRSKRYAEYFPPFAILFAAFSWREFLIPLVKRSANNGFGEREIGARESRSLGLAKQSALWSFGILLVVWMFYNIFGINTTNLAGERWKETPGLRSLLNIKENGLFGDIRGNEADEKYRRAADWMKENIPAGERIFNCNWDDFPKLFFLDTKHSYVYGLDPNYLYSKNPEIYKSIMDITAGKIDDPAPVIREKMGARYVFSDAKENADFINKCVASGLCRVKYEDDEAKILKVYDSKDEAASDAPEETKPAEEKPADAPAENQNSQVNNGETNQTN